MEVVNLIVFAALILGFLVLFLAPGRWWPRRRDDRQSTARERRDAPIPRQPLPPRPPRTPDDLS